MGYTHFERLSALDASFLALEDAATHMHIGAVGIFDAAPLATPDGGIDIERIRDEFAAGLHRVPRYRQRLASIPLGGAPVWIDDAHFNLAYHVRHTHLPRPGDERQLKRLVGRLMSQQLDRGKPLWEVWVVEGLEGGRFAFVTKIHHCMIDGVGSAELMATVMKAVPDDAKPAAPPRPWIPRPAPDPLALLAAEAGRRLCQPLGGLAALRDAVTRPAASVAALRTRAAGVGEALAAGLRPASPTPLNVPIGPHRRFDWLGMDLGTLRAIKGELGGTLNDLVLAMLAGALGRFLRQRGLDATTLDFRAMLPVNVRAAGDRELGNRVSSLVVRLPLHVRDPRQRLADVVAATAAQKRSGQAVGMRTLEELGDATFMGLFIAFARLVAKTRPFNVVVTNVPGPAFPVFVAGARMQACYPLVPLFEGQALGVALFSYDGRLHWGFNADWDVVPDLHELVDAVAAEYDAYVDAAGVARSVRRA